MGQTSILKVYDTKYHYLECYWRYFHPLFPIVHLATFLSTTPKPLLADSMVVIGAQSSPRPDAKQYSASLYTACLRMMSDVSVAGVTREASMDSADLSGSAVQSPVNLLYLIYRRSSI